ncbi:MAG: hypothetical protein LC650_02640 [Actinobacteria bacterium]|nr:hypothetical protein [Actinomycetota bacterium]
MFYNYQKTPMVIKKEYDVGGRVFKSKSAAMNYARKNGYSGIEEIEYEEYIDNIRVRPNKRKGFGFFS